MATATKTMKDVLDAAESSVRFMGDNRTGWSGHLEETPREVLDVLEPCPFCGGHDLELVNTHTPAYSVECLTCEAEKPGSNEERGEGHPKSKRRAIECHRRGIQSAIEEWNTRY